MRGDQFIRRWQVIRPMGASPEGLIVVEVIGHRPGTGIPTDEKHSKSLLQELQWAFLPRWDRRQSIKVAFEPTSRSSLQMTLTFQAEGRYYAGVQTERWVGGVLESQSAIGWSDDPVIVANQNTFGFKYFLPPGMAHGLRK